MTPNKQVPKVNPATEAEEKQDEDERTEVTTEYHGAKINFKIGSSGSMLLWAIAWAIMVISTMIGLMILVNMMDKLGVIRCGFSISFYLMAFVSAYWLQPFSLW